MSDNDKQALLDGSATIQTEIEVVDENTVLTEENSVVDWNHEDFRQVKNEGWIGQFVARQLTGTLKNLDDNFSITDKELELKLGVKKNDNTNWYSLGNFLVTKVTDDEVNDKTSFEALDYTKKFNKAYEDTIMYPCTALELAQNVCEQCGVVLGNTDFKNNNYQITGNAFTNNESCRDVMKAIGKLAGSWVRVDWDNKVYIDFDPTPFTTETTPSTYNTFGNNKYYNLKTQKEVFGPVNRVIIGYSAIEGERTIIEDAESIDENGLCEITIYDNPLVFNQEQRESIINSYSDLLGFTYTPLNTLTVGHPWLLGNELVRVSDMEGVSHDTIPLDRTIQYFGHIKTLINSTTETKTNNDLGYKPETQKSFERSEIYNDKINKEIGAIIEEQNGTNQRLNETISTLDGTVQRVSRTEEEISEIVTTTQTSLGGNSLYLENTLESNALSYSADGATEQTILPSEYTQVEYIESSGTQYINTNVKVKGTLRVKMNFENNDENIDGVIFGGRKSTNQDTFTFWLFKQNNGFRSDYNTISNQTSSLQSITGKFYIDKNRGFTTIIKDGVTYTKSIENSSFVGNGELVLFAKDNEGTIDGFTSYKLYDCKIYDNDMLIRDLVPCYKNSNGEIGLYDLVNSVFYTNSGTGTFTKGDNTPTTNSPQDVKTIPSIINLCNGISQGYWVNQAGTSCGVTTSDTGLAIPISGVSSYTISTTISQARYRVACVNTLPTSSNVIAYNGISKDGTSNSITIDTTGYNYLVVNATDLTQIQIEKGETAHDYIPYGHYARVKITGKNLFNIEKYYNAIANDYVHATINLSNNSITWYNSTNDSYFPGIWSYDMFNSHKKSAIEVKANTTYTFNVTSDGSYNRVYIYQGDENYNGINNVVNKLSTDVPFTFTTTDTTKYIIVRFAKWSNTQETISLSNIQIEESTESTSYEQYKEKEVLINLAKDNIFDGELELGGYEAGVKDNRTERYRSANKIPVKPSTTYTFSINDKAQRYVYQLYDANGNYLSETDTQTGTFTTTSNCYYITFRCFIADFTNDYANLNVQVYESTDATSYNELCKIGDYKDTLAIDSEGNCVINKNIGKYVLNGGENWTTWGLGNQSNTKAYVFRGFPSATDLVNEYAGCRYFSNNFKFDSTNSYAQDVDLLFINTQNAIGIRKTADVASTLANFKTWLSAHNTNVYYVLATPETITLPNTKIPLFSGINHVTFVDDLQTSTSIICYLNTPLSGTYATVTQLNEVSVEKSQEIQTTRTEVINEINNSNEQIRIINETIDETGVPILHTETGYTFDIDGIKIEKTDNDVKTTIDNDGLTTSYKGTEILTARSNGVEAENITTRKFYVQKPIRMEKTRALTDSTKVGLGFYYVGE